MWRCKAVNVCYPAAIAAALKPPAADMKSPDRHALLPAGTVQNRLYVMINWTLALLFGRDVSRW